MAEHRAQEQCVVAATADEPGGRFARLQQRSSILCEEPFEDTREIAGVDFTKAVAVCERQAVEADEVLVDDEPLDNLDER